MKGRVEYQDFSREELMAAAQHILDESGGRINVHFKATCPQCGERPMFEEPNMIYESMVCSECGHEFPFVKGNYMLEMRLGELGEG